MKNQGRETRYLKPYFLIKNFKSIEGELPKALKMAPNSKFFLLFNRYKVNGYFKTGIKPRFCRLEEIQNYEIIEPKVPEYADDKYFIDSDYEDANPDYKFEV